MSLKIQIIITEHLPNMTAKWTNIAKAFGVIFACQEALLYFTSLILNLSCTDADDDDDMLLHLHLLVTLGRYSFEKCVICSNVIL